MSTLPPANPTYVPVADLRQRVVVTDVDMSLGAMCRFIVKWVIASIPAMFILWLLMIAALFVLSVIFGGIFHNFNHHGVPWNY